MAIVLNDVASPNNTSTINSNFQKIEDALNFKEPCPSVAEEVSIPLKTTSM